LIDTYSKSLISYFRKILLVFRNNLHVYYMKIVKLNLAYQVCLKETKQNECKLKFHENIRRDLYIILIK